MRPIGPVSQAVRSRHADSRVDGGPGDRPGGRGRHVAAQRHAGHSRGELDDALDADGQEGHRHGQHAQRADHVWARAYTGDSSSETHRVRAVPAVMPRPIQYMVCERIMARHQKNRKTQG